MARVTIAGWADQDVVLYHGTLDVHVTSILGAVDVTRGRSLRDFGRGFYTTTSRAQARRWAHETSVGTRHNPAVVSFSVSRNDLAHLESLFFVRGDANAIDYWSFVHHCRMNPGSHRRLHAVWYDVVAGPVSGSYRKQTLVPNADQISFHTNAAASILNHSRKGHAP